jgi:hypothetical protein
MAFDTKEAAEKAAKVEAGKKKKQEDATGWTERRAGMIRDNLRLTPAVYIPGEVGFLDRCLPSTSTSPAPATWAAPVLIPIGTSIRRTPRQSVEYLELHGFKTVYAEYGAPESESTVDVWQARFGEFGELKVQVQLLRDVARTRTVRDIIKAHMLEQHIKMDREERAELWDTLHFALGLKAFATLL